MPFEREVAERIASWKPDRAAERIEQAKHDELRRLQIEWRRSQTGEHSRSALSGIANR